MIGGNGAYIELDNKVIKDETIQVEDVKKNCRLFKSTSFRILY